LRKVAALLGVVEAFAEGVLTSVAGDVSAAAAVLVAAAAAG
jgi:hypothetical protein